MAGPIDAILAFHNAFRRDIATIDAAALVWARGEKEPGPGLERFRFFNEALVWHATGEERAIFPALEKVAPAVAEAYEKDHRALDAAYEVLSGRYRRVTPWRPLGPQRRSSSTWIYI